MRLLNEVEVIEVKAIIKTRQNSGNVKAIIDIFENALLEKTNIYINISTSSEQFVAMGEVIKFEGFLKVYMESTDEDTEKEDGLLPRTQKGEILGMNEITAIQKFAQPPARYNEASLVKKMEELGIGRPSTYAPTISTIQKREYVLKEDREGSTRNFEQLTLKAGKIKSAVKTEKFGFEKNKLFPTDIGELVTRYLMQSFNDVMDYNFTASVEVEFDEIAEGLHKWNYFIRDFYLPFHKKVTETLESGERTKGEKLLGTDPKTGKNVYVKLGRYGSMAQIGESESEEKPRFVGLLKGQSLESISLEEALKLFDFPRPVGEYEGELMTVGIGRFGPYVLHKKKFYSLKKTDDPATITAGEAILLIDEKRIGEANRLIREFTERPDVRVLNGRFGPYFCIGKDNYKIPKGTEPASLSLEDCLEIAKNAPPPAKKKGFVRRVKK